MSSFANSLLEVDSHYARILSKSTTSTGFIRGSKAIIYQNIRDLDDNEYRTIVNTYSINHNDNDKNIKFNEHTKNLLPISSIPLHSKPIITKISPSGNKTFTVYKKNDKMYIYLNTNDGWNRKVDISNIHGDVLATNWLGGVSWSSNERYLAYCCKRKEEKNKFAYYDDDYTESDKGKNTDNEPKTKKGKYDYEEDWGEKMVGVTTSTIAIIDTYTGTIFTVPDIEKSLPLKAVGQPNWRPFSDSTNPDYQLTFVAWNEEPRRLGKLYCMNRPSKLYHCDLTEYIKKYEQNIDLYQRGEASKIEFSNKDIPPVFQIQLEHKIMYSPKWNPSGERLYFLGHESMVKTHGACMGLHFANIDRECHKISHLNSYYGDDTHLPGIHANEMPDNPFFSSRKDYSNGEMFEEEVLVLNTQRRSASTCYSINVTRNNENEFSLMILPLTELFFGEPQDMNRSISLLDISDGCMIYSISSPCSCEEVGYASIVDGSLGANLKFKSMEFNTVTTKNAPLDVYHPSPNLISIPNMPVHWEVQTFTNNNIDFECILMRPEAPEMILLVPHGGPHSAIPTTFIPSYTFYASYLNAAVLHCNYRGSIGFGQESIDSLPGNIGRNDVDDCMEILKWAQKKLKIQKVAVVGGSHGGFLTGHLIGQYPDTFFAAAMRNPVTNIPGMVTVTDIPDWCFIEALGLNSYDFESFRIPKPSELIKMHECSPVSYIDKVKTPTLLCLGMKDRRVPPSQGLEYYHLLKTRGVDVEMVNFPEDVHAIDKPHTEAQQHLSIANFIKKRLQL